MASTQVQYRRGTTSENNAFTGALAEITVDTTNNTLRVHDGVTAGGFTTVGLNQVQTLTNKTLNGVTVAGNIIGNLIPSANITYNLGSATRAWNSLYVAGNTIYLGSLQLKEISGNTFAVYTSDGVTQANIDVGNIDVSSITQGTSTIGISGVNGNAYVTVAGNANVAVFTSVGTNFSGNINAVANVNSAGLLVSGVGTVGTLAVVGNATINGDLFVNGNISYINVSTLAVEDPVISMGHGPNGTPLTSNDGKDRGTQLWYFDTPGNVEKSAFFGYDNSAGKMFAAVDVVVANEVVTVSNYGTFVAGTVEATTTSVTGNVNSGNVNTGIVSATGTVSGGNIGTPGSVSAVGNVNAGNVTTSGLVSATGNITGGNLITLGNVQAGGVKTDNLYYANGTPWDLQLPAGSNTQVQFNNNSDFGASANFTWNSATNTLSATNIVGTLITGNATGNTSITDGGITTGNSTANTNVTGGGITTGNSTANTSVTGGGITTGNSTANTNVTGGGIVTSNGNGSANINGGTISASGNITGNRITANTLQVSTAPYQFLFASNTNVVTSSNLVTIQDPANNSDGGAALQIGVSRYDTGSGNTYQGLMYFTDSAETAVYPYPSASIRYQYGASTFDKGIKISPWYNYIGGSGNTNFAYGVGIGTWRRANQAASGGTKVTLNAGDTGSSVHGVYIGQGAIDFFPEYGTGNAAGLAYIILPAAFTTESTDRYVGQISVNAYYNPGTPQWSLGWKDSSPVSPSEDNERTPGNRNIIWDSNNRVGINTANLNSSFNVAGNAEIQSGNLSVSGNVTAAYFIGNGSLLTNIPGGNVSGNVAFANVAGTVSTNAQPNITSVGTLTSLTVSGNTTSGNLLTGGAVSATGNITGGNIIGTLIGNLTGSTVSASGNITGGNLLTGGLILATGNIGTSGNVNAPFGDVIGGNLFTGGQVSAAGNVTGGNLITSGMVTATGNIQTSGRITATGNITGGNVISSGNVEAGSNVVAVGNISGANFNTVGRISATGNVTAANFIGNVIGNVIGNISGNLSTTGNVSANNVILLGTQANSVLQNNNDITGWYLTGNSFSVAAEETTPNGIFFKPDGTKMYIIGSSGDDITEYNLSTAWNITTASAVGVSPGLGDTAPTDLYISSDGTKCYIVGSTNDAVREFNFGTAWQANTLTFVQEFSVLAQESTPTGITFKPDLTQMFISGSTGDGVDVYNLSSAGNIATATFSTFVSLATQDTAPAAIQFNNNGTRFYMVGSTNDTINQYNLGTPYDLTTATFVNHSFWYGFVESTPTGMFLEFTQNRCWIVGSGSDTVLEIDTRGEGLRATGGSNYFDGYVSINKDLDVQGNAVVQTALNVVGAATIGGTATFNGTTSLSTTTVSGTLTATSTVTMSTTTGVISIGNAQTTGTTIIGGTSQTGAINIGRSTANQSIVIGNGVTASGSVKTIDIGTLGASGSNTNVTIGSITSGAQTNITLYGNTTAGNLTTTGLITSTGNVIGGNLNTTGQVTAASASVTGNIDAGNLRTTGQMTAAGNVTGGNLVTAGLATVTGNITGGNLVTAGLATVTGNVTAGNLVTAGLITSTGNVTGGNVLTAGQVSAGGNVTGANLVTGGLISATGNITTGNGNLNVTSGNVLSAGVFSTGQVSAAGNVTGANLITSGIVTATGNVIAGNVTTAGQVSATGNVTGGNVLTAGVVSAGSNIVAVGNITGGNILTSGQVSATGNITAGNVNIGPATAPDSLLMVSAQTATQGIANALGTIIHATGQSANITRITTDSYGTGVYTAYTGRHARGTAASPTQTVAGDLLAQYTARGYSNGSQGFGANSTGRLDFFSAQDQTDTARGTYAVIQTTANGAITPTIAVTITESQAMSVAGNITGANLITSGGVFANTVTGTATTVRSTGNINLSATGNIVLSTQTYINNLSDPVQAQDAATKAYVDNVAEGLHIQPSCSAATTTTLATISGGTVTYNNGTSGVGATLTTTGSYTTIDGVTLSNGMRILVKDEVTTANNGIYVRTSSTVLTRATDFDTPTAMAGGDFTFITAGTQYDSTGWVMVEPVTTVGTSAVVWTQFSGSGTYTAGTGLTLTGTQFSISNTVVTAGSYGNSTAIPTFTVNQQGQLTAASTAAVVAPAGTLTGSSLANNVVNSSLQTVGNLNSLSVVGNIITGNLSTAGTVSAAGNVTGGNLLTGGLISAAGGITGAAITGTSLTVSTGNITGGNLILSGAIVDSAQLDIQTSAANANIVLTPNGTGNVNIGRMSASGNITAATYFGSGAGLTSIPGANVTGTVASATTAATVTTAAQPNITSVGTLTALTVTGNTTSGNLLTGGLISATGQVTGSQFNGSGAGLTSIPGANVTGTVASATTAGTVTTAAQPNITSVGTLTSLAVTGNITAGNLTGAALISATNLTGTLTTAAQPNITSVGTLTSLAVTGNTTSGNLLTGGLISATGQVTGSQFNGSGAGLTSIPGGNVTGTVPSATSATTAGTVTTAAQPNITSVGTLTALTVTGNTTSGNLLTGGLISATGQVTGSQFNGSGAGLTSIPGGNVTGTVPSATSATSATTAGTVTTAAQPNITSVGTLTGLTVTNTITGNITGSAGSAGSATTAVTAGTVTTAAQPNITSVGTLTGLTVTNTITGNITGSAGSATTATTAGTVTTAAQPNITSVGTLSSLAVTGNTTSGNFIGTLNGSAANVTAINASNISSGTLAQARLANASLTVNGTSIALGGSGTVTANTTAALTFNNSGGGSASGVTFNGGTATTISYNTVGAPSTTGTNASGTWSINVTGSAGSATSATTAGTVTTAAQPNITSVGTLSSLTVSGGITVNSAAGATAITNGATNGVGNIGSSTVGFNTVFAKATSAQYADLAEAYTADAEYAPGTVLVFGGTAEVTVAAQASDTRIAGVVSTNPAHVMNAGLDAPNVVIIALTGRVPTKVTGTVRKGDMMVAAGNGVAQACATPTIGSVIGKALENFDGESGVIEVVVGRL